MSFLARCACVAPLLTLLACSSAGDAPSTDDESPLQSASRRHPSVDAGTLDASRPDAADAAPPVAYPAFLPSTAKLISRGGPFLRTPRVQVVTFAGDPLVNDIETLASRIGASSYWHQATSEYGVGALEMLPPVRLDQTAPASIDDADFGPWLANELDTDFGPPDPSTIYAVFYPAGTKVTIGTQLTGCVNSGGYHWDAVMHDGTDVPYVVMPRCAALGELKGLDALTSPFSHELAEAATDPLSRSNPAYFAMDDAHIVFADFYEAEIGDLCVQDRYLTVKPPDIGYTVQRLWSNTSAAAGHHPCVPAPLYFNAQPVLPDAVRVTSGGRTFSTQGVSLAVGASKTIELRLFSDGPMAAWGVTAYDIATVRGGTAELALSVDRPTGQNGDVLHLTVKRTARAARGFSEAMIWSHSATGESNFWPILVGD
jgi:hypothetical protein